MRTPLIALVLALALFIGACGASVAAPVDDDPAPVPVEPDDPDDRDDWPSMAIDWYGDFLLELPNGWTVRPCEGDGPFICFADGDRHVGTVEIGDWPLGDDFGGDARSYLHAHADRFIDDMRADRAEGCAHLTFDPVPTIDFSVGGATGVKGGFRMVAADGTEMERHVLYWAVHDGAHVVINAGAYADEGACAERLGEFTPHDLGLVTSYLDRIVEDSPLRAEVPDEAAAPLADGEHTARIVSIDGAVRVIHVAMVDVLSGQDAVDAAKQDGVLGADETEMPNDVYVRDAASGTIAVGTHRDIDVAVYDCSAECRTVTVDLDALADGAVRAMNGEHAVFELTVAGGEVVAITEIYLP